MTRSTIGTLLIVLACTMSGCHYEKYVVKRKPDSDINKHTILTTRDTDRKLDLSPKQEVGESRPGTSRTNLNYFPRNYFGFASIVAQEEDLVLNLKFSSDSTRNDTMYIEGNFSDNNKRSFENISIVIPIREVDQAELVSIVSDRIRLQAFLDIKYVFDREEAKAPNELEENGTPENIIPRDTLSNREISTPDSLSKEQSELSPVVFSNMEIYQNDDNIFAFAGELEYEGSTFKLVSQSDPLPLIPIVVAACAGIGIYKTRDYLKKIGVESKNRITAFVDRVQQATGN